MNDGRDLKTKAIEMHEHFSGKINLIQVKSKYN